jgi:hypothetical protein
VSGDGVIVAFRIIWRTVAIFQKLDRTPGGGPFAFDGDFSGWFSVGFGRIAPCKLWYSPGAAIIPETTPNNSETRRHLKSKSTKRSATSAAMERLLNFFRYKSAANFNTRLPNTSFDTGRFIIARWNMDWENGQLHHRQLGFW